MDKREIISELVCKECEAYSLIELGILPSVEEGIEMILPWVELPDDSFREDAACFHKWRKELLHLFYVWIDYEGFVGREKKALSFRRFLFAMKKRITGRLREDCKDATIDKDLAVPPQTLAFKLSRMLDEELYEKALPSLSSVCMPSDLEELCRRSCYSCFPVGKEGLFVRLKKKDTEFWDILYQTVKRLTELVTSGQYVSIQYRKEIIQDTWSDAALFLYRKITAEDIPEFESASHFRNYIARVCLNKLRESIRKNISSEVPLNVPGGIPEAEFQLAGEDAGNNYPVLTGVMEDIDMENNEEVSRMLTAVLWDKVEPWYSQLTKDIEDKTKLLFLHYAEGLPYDAMAAMQGSGKSEKELKRLENKMRQDAVRTRRLLKQRFMDLLRKNVK